MSAEAISLKRKLRDAVKRINEQREEIEKEKLDIARIQEDRVVEKNILDQKISTLQSEIDVLKSDVEVLKKPAVGDI